MHVLHLEVSVLTVGKLTEHMLCEGSVYVIDMCRKCGVGLGMEFKDALVFTGEVLLGHKLKHRLAADSAEGRLLGYESRGELCEIFLVIVAVGVGDIIEYLTDKVGVV